MQLSSLQAEIGRLLNDPFNTRWNTDVLAARINIAQTEIQGLTNAVKTRESISLISGVGSYSIDSNTMDIIRIYKVYTSGSAKPLEGINREELDFRFPNWNDFEPGDPQFFIYNASTQQVSLIPVPDQNLSLLSIYESRKPADLVNPTDIPFDSNNQMIPYHITIAYWVVAECWMDDGTPEALAKSRFFKTGSMLKPGQYEMEVGRIMSQFDIPEAVQERILWQPEGGRNGAWWVPSKGNPLPWFPVLFLIVSVGMAWLA